MFPWKNERAELPYRLAGELPATRVALRRRRRLCVALAVVATFVVFLMNAPMFLLSKWWPIAALSRLVLLCSGVAFIAAFVGYLRALWVESLMRRNPWVEFWARVKPIELRGVVVANVIELKVEDPDGEHFALRFMRGRRAKSILETPGDGDEVVRDERGAVLVWVCGDLEGTVAVSPVGGHRFFYARRPWLQILERRLSVD